MPVAITTIEAPSALTLSEEDVARLLSTDDAAGGCLEVSQRIASIYDKEALTRHEALLAEQIFRLLVRDTEISIRAAMAQTLKASASLPRDIVLTMARDVEEVALPVLECSEVLTDADLLELIRETPMPSRHNAIAGRKSVSEQVSDALVETDTPQVLAKLVSNEGAKLTPQAMERMVERHHADSNLMQRLAQRPSLPPTIAETLITVVSEKLATQLREKYRLKEPALAKETEAAREYATLALIRLQRTPEDVAGLVRQLITFRRLTPGLLLASLCHNHLLFVETAFAEMAGIPVSNARKLLTDKGGLGLRALYEKAALPQEFFPAMHQALSAVRTLSMASNTSGIAFADRVRAHLAQQGGVNPLLSQLLKRLQEEAS